MEIDKEELREMIRETVYEVLEPFVAQMSRDYEESRRWMRSMEERMGSMETWMRSMEERMRSMEERMSSMEARIERIEARLSSLERRVSRLEDEVWEIKTTLRSLEQLLIERGVIQPEAIPHERWATFQELRQLEQRVTQLEIAVFHQADGQAEEEA